MKARFLLVLLAGVVALHAQTIPEAAPEVPPEDPREVAKREAWMSAVLIISLLEQGDNAPFPGIRAWLEDFHHAAASTPPPEPGKPFLLVDSDRLVTRNPNFWMAFYEVQPGDPGLALLHSALLLSGGEAQRAAALAAFGLQRPAIPEEIKRGLTSVIAHCQSAQARSLHLVNMGVKLHDLHEFAGALKKYDEAIAEWPANGAAYYERGSTIRMKAIAEARRTAGSAAAPPSEAPPDPPETVESFARARRHDPLHLLAYQGDDPALLPGLMALVRSGLPVWESIRRHPDQPAKTPQLRSFSDACREAGIDEFALALRQLVVSSNRRYSTDDDEFIRACLQRLAPAALTPPLLARISGEARLPARHIVVPVVVEPPDLTQTNAEEDPPREPKKKDPADSPKQTSKSSKSKRKVADNDNDPPAKAKSTAKKKRKNQGA
jgi:hypothetical protein